VFDEMSARDDSLNLSGTFLWLDEDDSNNTMGAFLGLVQLVSKILKKGFLMSYGKTKTLELGLQDLRGKYQDRFYLKDRMKITYIEQNIN
jgi:hypothetical protein